MIRVFSGNAHPALADKICRDLGITRGAAVVSPFADGEISVDIKETVRAKDVYVVQPTCRPDVNGALMELLVMLDALSRASAERITAVIPYYGYARQDRKVSPRAPITAKLVADLLTAAGADRVLTVDLHAGQIQGFFNIPVDNLYATAILSKRLIALEGMQNENDLVIVSPDAGGVRRARYLAHILERETSLAFIDKRRSKPGKIAEMTVVGDVDGKTAVMVDDMIDSGGTIVKAADVLKQHGAKRVFAVCTHPVFSNHAERRIQDSSIERLIVTDTIPLTEDAEKVKKIEVISVSELLARAIANIHLGGSVSSLFKAVEVIN
ncbi:MAG: ribose-phosphate pyrophosphokinase [Deltaproteobacteria bacterium]|nr:ribose-phosphate pyrophosphokinase [Deltaproteobacteria bacterium]MCB9478306.1 ribose-phosphate pyrophosphokinase [Deltaproteobacteria bacterium]MCB9489290.1 ribose-phosphate pyrophosphokinase [Deltaproteobacteria bacterium]